MDLGKLRELAEHRVCPCGAEFWTEERESALQQYADHLMEHYPTPEQWTEAWKRIQALRNAARDAAGR